MEDTFSNAPSDTVARVRTELEEAMERDDAVRLKTLDDLYRSLEGELEGDLGSSGFGSTLS